MKDRNVLDLRDMPLFYEDISEESFVPIQGPKRLDGLSQPADEDLRKPKRSRKPWLGIIVIAPLLGSSAVGFSLHTGNQPHVERPNTAAKVTQAVQTGPVATTSATVVYVTPFLGLKLYDEANGNGAVTAIAQFKSPLTVIRDAGSDWYYVQYGDVRAYALKEFVSPQPGTYGPVADAATNPAPVAATSNTPTDSAGSGNAGAPTDTTTPPTDPGTTPPDTTGTGTGGTIDPGTGTTEPGTSTDTSGSTSNSSSTSTTTAS